MIDERMIAECNHLRNDIFWDFGRFYNTDKGYEWFKCMWTGYNDANWWDNVATKEEYQTRKVTGDKGTVKTFKIDFKTNIVTEVTE